MDSGAPFGIRFRAPCMPYGVESVCPFPSAFWAAFSPSLFAGTSAARCSVKVKVVPLPASLSAQIFSPISDMISLAMDSPSPVPPPLCAFSTL